MTSYNNSAIFTTIIAVDNLGATDSLLSIMGSKNEATSDISLETKRLRRFLPLLIAHVMSSLGIAIQEAIQFTLEEVKNITPFAAETLTDLIMSQQDELYLEAQQSYMIINPNGLSIMDSVMVFEGYPIHVTLRSLCKDFFQAHGSWGSLNWTDILPILINRVITEHYRAEVNEYTIENARKFLMNQLRIMDIHAAETLEDWIQRTEMRKESLFSETKIKNGRL